MIASWLSQRAEISPAAPALHVGDVSLSFGELSQRVDLLTAKIANAGWSDKRVAVWLPEGLDLLEAMWAVPQSGATVLPLHAKLKQTEVAKYLAQFDCSHLYTTSEWGASLSGTLGSEVDLLFVKHNDAESVCVVRRTPIKANSPHSIWLTSGTTGQPKAVVLSYGNHLASAEAWSQFLKFQVADHYLCPLPLTHVGGMAIMIRGAINGFQVTYLPSFEAGGVNSAIDNHGISHLSVVPAQLHQMLLQRQGQPYGDSLRAVVLGGAAATEALIRDAESLHLPLVLSYGMTETASGIAARRLEPGSNWPLWTGSPLGKTSITIVDHRGAVLSRGTTGAVAISGPTVMLRYLGGEPNKGHIVTQDLGSIDDEGRLTLLPRSDQMIITGGENIDPTEVEQIILSQTGITDVCVLGLPDAEFGERVVAVVVASAAVDLDINNIFDACAQQLASFKNPRSIYIWPDLPRSPIGKLLREKVRERLIGTVGSEP